MSQPIVNTAIKPLSEIKGAPASSAVAQTDYYDWGVPTAKSSAQSKGLFKTETNYIPPLKQIGMDAQYKISLPCVEVNDLANKRIKQGEGVPFNRSTVVAKPITGMDAIAFVKKDRVDYPAGMDASQRPFTFGSFNYKV